MTRVYGLAAENFQILRLVDVKFEDGVTIIRGENEQGKSSLLRAIWVALAGRAVAPPKPIRKGEEQCRIRLDLGDLIVTRTFTEQPDGKPYTDAVKVESADGKQRYQRPQQVLNELMGELGFDPLRFKNMKPEDQAETLLELVPLPIDLAEMARFDTADFENRTEINRDVRQLQAQIDAIPVEEVPEDAPDLNALTDALGNAANTNAAIERERMRRESMQNEIQRVAGHGTQSRARMEDLRRQLEEAEAEAEAAEKQVIALQAEYDALPPEPEAVDTDAIREQLRTANDVLARIDRQKRRAELVAQHAAKAAEAQRLTDMLDQRENDRKEALKKARMPVEGLEFVVNDKGKPQVFYRGVPFEQASDAVKIKTSLAIAMAANPELRMAIIRDGSLLDKSSVKLIAEMCAEHDFQVVMEVVGEEGVGVVLRNGEVVGAPAAPEQPKKAAAKKADKPDGGLL